MDKVFCAAIKDINGRIWIGFAHGTIIPNMFPRNERLAIGSLGAVQGFVINSHDGEFVTREKALEIATKAGQIIFKHNPTDKLLSEDLRERLHPNMPKYP